MNRRRLTALVLATLIWMQGCATPDYRWSRLYDEPASEVHWITVPQRDDLYWLCEETEARAPTLAGCAYYYGHGLCTVYSDRTERFARQEIVADGLTLYEHEVWTADKHEGHCAGFVHNQFKNRGM